MAGSRTAALRRVMQSSARADRAAVTGRESPPAAPAEDGCAPCAGLLAFAATSPAGAPPPRLVKSVLSAASGPAPAAVGELVKELP